MQVLELDARSGAVRRRTPPVALGSEPGRPYGRYTDWSYEGHRAAVQGDVAFESLGSLVRRRDLRSDQLGWERWLDSTATAPVLSADLVVVGTLHNQVIALDRETGRERWRVDVFGRVAAPPILADGWVYGVTVDGTLFGFPAPSGDADGWPQLGADPARSSSR